MEEQLATGNSVSFALDADDYVSVTGSALVIASGPSASVNTTNSGTNTYGPYAGGASVRIVAAGAVSYDVLRIEGGTSTPAVRAPYQITSNQWVSASGFCQIVLTGTGSYTYDTMTDAGSVSLSEGSGTVPDVVPVYMGGATKLRVIFPATATAKVN